MLEGFPVETPVIPAKTKPVDLEGFYPESSPLAKPVVETGKPRVRAAAPVAVTRRRPRSGLFIGSVAALAIVIVAIGIAPAWRTLSVNPPLPPVAAARATEPVPPPQHALVAVSEVSEAELAQPATPSDEVSDSPAAPADRPTAGARSEPDRVAKLPERTQPVLARVSRAARPDTPSPTQIPPQEQTRAVALATPVATLSSLVSRSTAGIEEAPPVVQTAVRTDVAAAPPSIREVAAPAPASVATVDEAAAIRNVIQRYRAAYESLDATAAKEVWPSVDERALARAFAGLQSQTLTLRPCQIDVTGSGARAVCRGSARYVGRVGNRASAVQPREWRFALHKTNDGWQIDSVRTQAADYGSNE